MFIIECSLGILFVALSMLAIKSDWETGLIRNKILFFFLLMAAVLDSIYYIFFARAIFPAFIANISVITCVSCFLFYTHSFAGGDSKLAIVLAFCYPGGFYLNYGNVRETLVAVIGFAILGGYIYLLIYSLAKLNGDKQRWNSEYIKKFFVSFVRPYIVAMIYISLINIVVMVGYGYGITANIWLVRVIYMAVAWSAGKYNILHKRQIFFPILLLDILGSFYLGRLPFSVNPIDYVMVLVLLLCRMSITTGIYEDVKIENLNKGMILSSPSSMLMQNSKIEGLPGLSTEDLKSRLSTDEVKSIQEWAKNRGITGVTVVKKIPFAVFLVAGYFAYFIIWCLS